MSKTERVIAYIMQQLNLIGENFGWQIGKVGANYENGYMKCSQDSKAHFRKEKIRQDIEQILREEHIVESNKKVVTNADRIRNMSDEELHEFLDSGCMGMVGIKWCDEHPCSECIGKWLKEKVE